MDCIPQLPGELWKKIIKINYDNVLFSNSYIPWIDQWTGKYHDQNWSDRLIDIGEIFLNGNFHFFSHLFRQMKQTKR